MPHFQIQFLAQNAKMITADMKRLSQICNKETMNKSNSQIEVLSRNSSDEISGRCFVVVVISIVLKAMSF